MNFVCFVRFFMLALFVIDLVDSSKYSRLYRLFDKLKTLAGLFTKEDIKTKWIDQPLDHFDTQETRRWKMRYFEKLTYWKPKGPIFLYINGENEASNAFMSIGNMADLAKELNGAMFASEHRYYGKSQPFQNHTTENLKYLSSRQALADIASLILHILQSPSFSSSKIIVFGGSYAGNLATWMRLLYPRLVDAALASSAPLLAQIDFNEYFDAVSDDIQQYGTPGCYKIISNIFKHYSRQLTYDIKILKLDENVCKETDMTLDKNQENFLFERISIYGSHAQYSSLNTIKEMCEDLRRHGPTLHRTSECTDYDFERQIDSEKRNGTYIPWFYQTCSEFGFFFTVASKDHNMFPIDLPIDFYYKKCKVLFGSHFDKKRIENAVHKTNKMYGGRKPKVTNVIFVNGALDPYHKLGVLKDLSSDAPAILVPDSSHCHDLFPDRDDDSKELREARIMVKSTIKKWIGVQ